MIQVFVASTYRRLAAHLVDAFIKAIFFSPAILQGVYHYVHYREWSFSLYLLVSCWLLDFSFRVLCLRLMSATPGKMLFGLRVVSCQDSDRPLMLVQALIRVTADQLAFFLGWGLWSLALFRHDRTHLSDWLAETRVVQSYPRLQVPRRRWFLGVILVLYFSISGWVSASRTLQSFEISKGQVLLNQSIPD